MRKKIEINRRKYPYRGLQTEVGKIMGITPQAVGYALDKNSPIAIALYDKLLSERMNGIDSYRKNQKKSSRIVG